MRTEPDAPSRRTQHARRLFAGLPSTYDAAGQVFSFGQDPRWRGFLVSRVAAPTESRVLDVASGTAAVAIELGRTWQGRVVGLDQSEPMLREGVVRTALAGLADRTTFVLGQAERLPFPDHSFDGLTFTYLLRYVDDPAATLAELARVVKPGATMAGLEFHIPPQPWQPLWWAYTRGVMPVVGRVISRDWWEVGRFLGPSISTFYARHPLPEQLEMWRAAGIEDVRNRVMTLGAAVVIWGRKGGGHGR
jgi:demethylmenaquinone methyltransferase / 2-methoxy-6-polyprenyl-1,4-benzoquinol methylase